MTGPIVVVSRDVTRDPLRVEWFEDEDSYYASDPVAWVEFHRDRDTWCGKAGRYARPETSLAAARALLALSLDGAAPVARLATHFVPEPGAPLEPVPEVAA